LTRDQKRRDSLFGGHGDPFRGGQTARGKDVDAEIRSNASVDSGSAQSPRTVTRKLPLLTLPAASVALQVTVEIPIRKKLPEAGEQLTVGAGSTLSVALTLNVTTAPRRLVAVVMRVPGSDRIGAVTSAKLAVTVVLAVRVTLQLPVPEQAPLQPVNLKRDPCGCASVTVLPLA